MVDMELGDRISQMLKRSRESSGKSQSYVAKKLGVSKATVQNWENGLSSPSLRVAFEWFDVIGVPIYPYVNYVCHSKIDDLSETSDCQNVREELKRFVNEMPEHTIREMMYMIKAEHGSSPIGLFEMITCYLHLPLARRVSRAQSVGTEYLMCEARNELINPKEVVPDTEVLHEYVQAGYKAVIEGKNSYV